MCPVYLQAMNDLVQSLWGLGVKLTLKSVRVDPILCKTSQESAKTVKQPFFSPDRDQSEWKRGEPAARRERANAWIPT